MSCEWAYRWLLVVSFIIFTSDYYYTHTHIYIFLVVHSPQPSPSLYKLHREVTALATAPACPTLNPERDHPREASPAVVEVAATVLVPVCLTALERPVREVAVDPPREANPAEKAAVTAPLTHPQ